MLRHLLCAALSGFLSLPVSAGQIQSPRGVKTAPPRPAILPAPLPPALPGALPGSMSALPPAAQATLQAPSGIDQDGQKGALDAAFDGGSAKNTAPDVVDEAYAPAPSDATGNPVIIPDRLKPLLPGTGFDRDTWTGRVTLHLHSVYSDGVMEPSAVVQFAYDKGVRALSLTEHDTTASTLRAYRKAKELGMEYHTGVEITARGGAHIGAIDVDVTNPKLVAMLGRIRDARYQKAAVAVTRLNKNEEIRRRGITLTIEEVVAKSRHHEGGTIQRPHIARVLVDKGLAASVSEAFDTYLKDDLTEDAGLPEDPTPAEVIQTVHAAGGKAILNHPYTVSEFGDEAAEKIVRQFAAMGLDGIEVYRRAPGRGDAAARQADERAARWLLIADDFDLAVAPGSDFHGDDTHLNRIVVWMPRVLADQLLERLKPARAAALAVLERLDPDPGSQPSTPPAPPASPAAPSTPPSGVAGFAALGSKIAPLFLAALGALGAAKSRKGKARRS